MSGAGTGQETEGVEDRYHKNTRDLVDGSLDVTSSNTVDGGFSFQTSGPGGGEPPQRGYAPGIWKGLPGSVLLGE